MSLRKWFFEKDIAFFQIAIVSVLLIASFDSSIYIKKHIQLFNSWFKYSLAHGSMRSNFC